MRQIKGLILIFIFCCIVSSVCFAQTLVVSRADAAKEYFPGDFIHIIVDAPVDTAQITALMPDSSIINLVQERRGYVWRGIWQVPVQLRPGSYSSKLTAIDVSGNIFEGQTDTYVVKQLALITLVGVATKETRPALAEKITIEPIKEKPGAEQDLIKLIQKLTSQPAPGPVPVLKPSEKSLLIERNLTEGKNRLESEKFAEAANYFRIVLYLDPSHKEAGSYLAESLLKAKESKALMNRLYILSAIGFILGLAAVVFLFRYFSGVLAKREKAAAAIPQAPVKEAPKAITKEDARKAWFEKLGWKQNPFSPDIFSQMFIGENNLEFDGLKNFIRTRIESSGGADLKPFTDSALEKVFEISKGKPKEALKICDWSANKAIEMEENIITTEIVSGYGNIAILKILIADDEEVVRSTLEAILKKGGGYDVDFATDGEEVIKKVKTSSYGAVLLDIVMPKLDGYEVLRRVREISPELPIIFVSGRGNAKQIMDSLTQYHLTALIEKPFTPEQVLDVVAKSLKLK